MEWFNNLSVAEKVYFLIAVIASVLLVVQIIMLLFSFGSDVDFDAPSDGDIDIGGDGDVGDGLSLFTIKSLTAFFALGGWCGFVSQTFMPENIWAPILIAVATGTAALFGVAFAMRGIAKMQCSGNIVKSLLVGCTATVYVSVPQNRSGRGKVTLTAQGRYMELDAVTDGDRLPVDTAVEICEYNEDFVVVKKKMK